MPKAKRSAIAECRALLAKQLAPRTLPPLDTGIPSPCPEAVLPVARDTRPATPIVGGIMTQPTLEQPAPTEQGTEHASPAQPTKSVISREYKARSKKRTPDWIRQELREAQNAYENGLRRVARENGLLDRWNTKWTALNKGMQAMNLGNMLRHMQKHGMPVTILGQSEPGHKQLAA